LLQPHVAETLSEKNGLQFGAGTALVSPNRDDGQETRSQSNKDSKVKDLTAEAAAQKQLVKELLKFKKFYTNRNFNFVGLFTQNSKDTNFKLRFNKAMPRKNPMLPVATQDLPRRRNSECNSTVTSQSMLSPAQQLHLHSGHFSRWPGSESKATGVSPIAHCAFRLGTKAQARLKSEQRSRRQKAMTYCRISSVKIHRHSLGLVKRSPVNKTTLASQTQINCLQVIASSRDPERKKSFDLTLSEDGQLKLDKNAIMEHKSRFTRSKTIVRPSQQTSKDDGSLNNDLKETMATSDEMQKGLLKPRRNITKGLEGNLLLSQALESSKAVRIGPTHELSSRKGSRNVAATIENLSNQIATFNLVNRPSQLVRGERKTQEEQRNVSVVKKVNIKAETRAIVEREDERVRGRNRLCGNSMFKSLIGHDTATQLAKLRDYLDSFQPRKP